MIRSIRRWLGRSSPPSPAGIGDDCAVMRPARGRELLTVDAVVRGVHFSDGTRPRDVGAKLMKRNLSDIAAMGGSPRAAVVALALDGRVSLSWLEKFYRGLAAEARRHAVAVVGGDVTRLDGSFVATLALAGESTGRILTRSGSRPGDWIYVTGSLGRSLQTGHHLHFSPRLAEGRWLARRDDVRAMIDVSDGLAKDAGALAPAGASPAIYSAMLPRRGGRHGPRGALRRRGLRARVLRRVAGRPPRARAGMARGVSAHAPHLRGTARSRRRGPARGDRAWRLPWLRTSPIASERA